MSSGQKDSPITHIRSVLYDGETSEKQKRYNAKIGPEVLRERVRRSRNSRPVEVRREIEREYNLKLRVQALMLLGGNCSRCNNDDMRVLQIDHVNGGGTKENKKIHARGICIKAMENPTEYQVLCANCNWIKRWERNENKPRK